MTLKGHIIENRSKLPLQLVRASALSWWNKELNLYQRLELQRRWYNDRTLYTLTGREIQQIWESEVSH